MWTCKDFPTSAKLSCFRQTQATDPSRTATWNAAHKLTTSGANNKHIVS